MKRWLAALVLVAMLDPLSAAPITFNTALPVGKTEFIHREQVVVRTFEADRSDAERDLEVSGLVSVLGYGVTPKLTVFAALPYWDKNLRVTTKTGRFNRSSTGIGDLSVFARYTLHQADARHRTLRVAGLAGVKAPSGDDDDSDQLGRLPVPLQAGTGSWDSFMGVVITYQTLPYQLDAQVSYAATGSAQQFQAGDTLRGDVSLQHRLWPNELGADSHRFLYGVLEASLINQQSNAVSGVGDPNSGGTSVYVSPGIQYVARRWIFEAGLQVPVSQDLNGTALETDKIFFIGYRTNF